MNGEFQSTKGPTNTLPNNSNPTFNQLYILLTYPIMKPSQGIIIMAAIQKLDVDVFPQKAP